jgi:uncharacterized RDD family membrane protein YckC
LNSFFKYNGASLLIKYYLIKPCNFPPLIITFRKYLILAMDDEYYVLEDGEKTGPFTFNELIDREINVDTPVLIPSVDTWQNASYLPEFNDYFEAKGFYFPTEDNLATVGWRILAFIIDYIFVSAIAITIALQAGWVVLPTSAKLNPLNNIIPERSMLIIEVSFSVMFLIYHTLFEVSGMRGGIGKKICGLKVVDEDGRGLTLIKALSRNFGVLLSFMVYGLPFFTLFFSEHKQTWYERLVKTYMIRIE